ncbi:hypothetical protein D035_3147 [Vibrio parahaemolyticus VP250]|nr:hypothetical protein D035_3147 [Vibrio parahaemolyticus VP250]
MLPSGRCHKALKEDFACFAWTEKKPSVFARLALRPFPFFWECLLPAIVFYLT